METGSSNIWLHLGFRYANFVDMTYVLAFLTVYPTSHADRQKPRRGVLVCPMGHRIGFDRHGRHALGVGRLLIQIGGLTWQEFIPQANAMK